MCHAIDLSSPQLFGSKPQVFFSCQQALCHPVLRLTVLSNAPSLGWKPKAQSESGLCQGQVRTSKSTPSCQLSVCAFRLHFITAATLSLWLQLTSTQLSLPWVQCHGLMTLLPDTDLSISPLFPAHHRSSHYSQSTWAGRENSGMTTAWKCSGTSRDGYCTTRELEDFLNFLSVTSWNAMLWWDFLLSTRNETIIRWQKSYGGGNTCTQLTEGWAFAFTACYQKAQELPEHGSAEQGLSCGVFRQFSTGVARAGMLSHPKQEVKTYRSIGVSSRMSPIQYIPQNTTGSLQNGIVSRCILKSRETLVLCWQAGDHF